MEMFTRITTLRINRKWTLVLCKSVCIAIVALTLHILLSNLIDPIISQKMSSIKVKLPPYGFYITFFAYLTALIPAFGMLLLYEFMTNKIQLKKMRKLSNGIFFSFIFLLAEGELIRQPIMNLLIGNPPLITVLMLIKSTVPILSAGILIAYMSEP